MGKTSAGQRFGDRFLSTQHLLLSNVSQCDLCFTSVMIGTCNGVMRIVTHYFLTYKCHNIYGLNKTDLSPIGLNSE